MDTRSRIKTHKCEHPETGILFIVHEYQKYEEKIVGDERRHVPTTKELQTDCDQWVNPVNPVDGLFDEVDVLTRVGLEVRASVVETWTATPVDVEQANARADAQAVEAERLLRLVEERDKTIAELQANLDD